MERSENFGNTKTVEGAGSAGTAGTAEVAGTAGTAGAAGAAEVAGSSKSTAASRAAEAAKAAEPVPHRRIRTKLWAAAGFVCFGLGAVGVALPILPTTPFMLLAAFCFARSSQRLNDWFHATKLYQTVLADYVSDRRMTRTAKLKIIVPVTLLLGLSFILMSNVPIGRAVVVVVWVAHIIYFGFMVRTIPESEASRRTPQEADAGEVA